MQKHDYKTLMGLLVYLKFNRCAWVYILKFCHVRIVSRAVDARKWSAKWRKWNITAYPLHTVCYGEVCSLHDPSCYLPRKQKSWRQDGRCWCDEMFRDKVRLRSAGTWTLEIQCPWAARPSRATGACLPLVCHPGTSRGWGMRRMRCRSHPPPGQTVTTAVRNVALSLLLQRSRSRSQPFLQQKWAHYSFIIFQLSSHNIQSPWLTSLSTQIQIHIPQETWSAQEVRKSKVVWETLPYIMKLLHKHLWKFVT